MATRQWSGGDAARALAPALLRRPLGFVMMRLRRRSGALRCFPASESAHGRIRRVRQHAQGVSIPRPIECVATLKGHSEDVRCGVHCTWRDDMSSPRGNALGQFSGPRCGSRLPMQSGSADKPLKVWDVKTGECVATLKGHRGARCDVRCTCVMSHRSAHIPRSVAVFPDGKASCLGSSTTRSRCGTHATGECVAIPWKGTKTRCSAHCTFVMICASS